MGTIVLTYKSFGHHQLVVRLRQDAFCEGSEEQGLLQALSSEV